MTVGGKNVGKSDEMNRLEKIRINLSVKWRLFKEKLVEIFVCRGNHLPTLLIDDETIVCDRCGKVLGRTAPIRIPDSKPIIDSAVKALMKEEHFRDEKPVEEKIREEWLPKPTTRRRPILHRTKPPPAARHSDAIRKHMGGKGRPASWYRKSIKKSRNLDMEEEED